MSALKDDIGPAEPLAALGLRRLALGRLADDHHGVDVDLGQSAAHGIERRTAAVAAVATPDPIERGAGRPLGDAAERKDERRIDRTRILHDGSSHPSRLGTARVVRLAWNGKARQAALYLMGVRAIQLARMRG